ncbi:MAG: voltage-gated chloride channel family protein [Pseudomonadota bacterium]
MKHLTSYAQLMHISKWFMLSSAVAIGAGSASAFFLFALEWATATRLLYPWIIWLLPIAGFLVGWIYLWLGQPVEAGNNLLIDEIHDPTNIIPLRMVPLILGSTILSHLFGASVGREGTAVQMGGALADQLARLFKLTAEDRRIILMTGISAGFASVFGTPLAGAIFSLEVIAIGRMRYDALLPCLIAAIVADQIGLSWGVHHTHYSILFVPALSPWNFFAVVVAGAIFGLTSKIFANSTHYLTHCVKMRIRYAPLRPLLGGIIIAVAYCLFNAHRYSGLGISTIKEAFHHQLPFYDFAGKMAFTIASLSSGFKGGEVTPLFYIGATLGNALAPLLHMPLSFFAGLGFIAVFAGAANTPIACTFMAIELFGAEIGIYAAIACVVSYLFSGHTGIYRSQRIGQAKYSSFPEGIKISELSDYHQEHSLKKLKNLNMKTKR